MLKTSIAAEQTATGQNAGSKSRQKARARHVSAMGRIAAWIAAAACDKTAGFYFAAGFAVVHGLLWTVILTALKGAQDVHMDVAEAFAWGQKFLLGYGKHPPLSGWIAGLWFQVFPVADWSSYALAMATIGSGLVICWLIAVRVVDRRRAMFSIVMLAIYPIFNFKGFKYNADLLQLVTLPLVVLAYLHAFEKRDVRSGVWLGLAAAAAMMTKYWVLTMIGAVGLAALIHPQRMNLLRSPMPWVALATFVLAMVPHLWWLQQANFLPLVYAGDVYGSRTFAQTSWLVLTYVAHNIGLLLLPVALAGLALMWRPWSWRFIRETGLVRGLIASLKRPWMRDPNSGVDFAQACNVWAIQIIVGLVPPIAAVIFGIYMKTDWGISLFFLTPLALIAIPALRITQMALMRLMSMWLVFTLIMLMAAPMIAMRSIRQQPEVGSTFNPTSQFAQQLTDVWRTRFNSRWTVVVATTEAGELMTFYSPDHPLTLTPWTVWTSGLTSLEEARRLGFIGICDTTDYRLPVCEAWMNANAQNAERLDLGAQRFFHGNAGPAVRWKIWLVPPARQ